MSAVDEILAAINPQQLAAAVGTDTSTAMDAAAAAIPTLLASLQANSSSTEGASSLFEALGQHANDLFGDSVDLAGVDTDDGRKIVAHALADDPQRLQAMGGFGGGLLSKLLPLLAPVVMSYLAKKLMGGSSSGSGGGILSDLLGGLLGGGATAQPQTVPVDTGGQVFSTQDAAGNIQIPTDTTQPAYPQAPSGGGNILGDLLGQILGR